LLETTPDTPTPEPPSDPKPTIRERAIEDLAAELKLTPLIFVRDLIGYPEYALMVRERERAMMAAGESARILIDESAPCRRWLGIAYAVGIALVAGATLLLMAGSPGNRWVAAHDKDTVRSEHYIRDGELCGRVYESPAEPAWLAEVTSEVGKHGPEIHMGGLSRRDAEKWVENACR
jgi:hypothetical protein